jgi:hypothetical protein
MLNSTDNTQTAYLYFVYHVLCYQGTTVPHNTGSRRRHIKLKMVQLALYQIGTGPLHSEQFLISKLHLCMTKMRNMLVSQNDEGTVPTCMIEAPGRGLRTLPD